MKTNKTTIYGDKAVSTKKKSNKQDNIAGCDYSEWLKSYNESYEIAAHRLQQVNHAIKNAKNSNELGELHKRRSQLYADMSNIQTGINGIKAYIDVTSSYYKS